MSGGISTIISFITKYFGSGAKAASAGINDVKGASTLATRAMTQMGSVISQLDGKFGEAARGVGTFIASVQAMGAIGAIIAGVQIVIDQLLASGKKAADEMATAAEKAAARTRAALDEMNKARMDEVNKTLAEATTKAKEAADAFDTMAAAYMRVEQAAAATVKSGMSAGMSALNLEKVQAMSGQTDDRQRALIGADYDVRIAQRQMEDTRAAQEAAVAAAEDDALIKSNQAQMARDAERKALAAKKKATAEYELDDNSGNVSNIEKSKAAKDAAEKAYTAAVNDRIRKESEAASAEERIIQAQNERTTALNDSKRNLIEAREAEARLIDAQKKAAEAELEQMRAAEAAAEASRRKAAAERKAAEREENAGTLTAFRDSSTSQFEQAFNLWRDPEAAASAVEADQKRSADMKAFRKAVNRYSGKSKIDEYAQLMRAGDEEGMQERLSQWRKSSKFTPQVEQMVKAAAAEQNKNAAEKSLANIEKNTSDLAKKIDELLSLK